MSSYEAEVGLRTRVHGARRRGAHKIPPKKRNRKDTQLYIIYFVLVVLRKQF